MNKRLRNLYKLQDGKCFYCKVDVIPTFPEQKILLPDNATRDHIICRSINLKLPNNTVLACHSCNQERADTPFLEFFLSKNKTR